MADNKERWMDLCRLAAVEQDSAKLLGLVDEINRLVEEDQRRKAPGKPPARLPDRED